jgi:hypothetical protein
MASATPAPRLAAANADAGGAQPGLARRRTLLIIGALMLGMLLARAGPGRARRRPGPGRPLRNASRCPATRAPRRHAPGRW